MIGPKLDGKVAIVTGANHGIGTGRNVNRLRDAQLESQAPAPPSAASACLSTVADDVVVFASE